MRIAPNAKCQRVLVLVLWLVFALSSIGNMATADAVRMNNANFARIIKHSNDMAYFIKKNLVGCYLACG